MSIRLIASDMDGTLLDQYTNITPATIEAIHRLPEFGVEFLICSGRDYRDARNMTESRGIFCNYICLSGATVYGDRGELLVDLPLTPENITTVDRVLSEHGAYMDILSSNGRYSTESRESKMADLCHFLNGRKPLPEIIPEEIKKAAEERISTVKFVESIREIPAEVKIHKICSNHLPEELVIRLKELFSACPDIAAASSFRDNIELTNVAAQKGHALREYARLKGIALEDVMVLGDSDNDLSMFTPDFGWTVAMGNAMPCICDNAKYHTKSNAEDGVAWAIRKYVFGEVL